MFFTKKLASFALPALLLCGFSSATPTFSSGPRIRQLPWPGNGTSWTTNSTTAPNPTSTTTTSFPTTAATPAILEPVIPPDVDVTDFSILALDIDVTLAWAGSTSPDSNSTLRRSLKRDTGVLSQANMTFRYPAVPLDQSIYVSGISCSSGTLRATLTAAAYTFVKKAWTGAPRIIFITAADGCGLDHANDLFLTKSIGFSDSDFSFTAIGASAGYKDVGKRFDLQWGDVGTYDLRRSVDKRSMFEAHPLRRRAEISYEMSWSAYLNDDRFLGSDEDAPWENAALLFRWGKEDGEEDDSYKKGEVASDDGHHKLKRSSMADLDERDLDYGLALYCVECGFEGSAKLWGEMSVEIFPPSVDKVQIGFDATFKAGLYLGLEAFVKYEKEWEETLAKIPVGGFSIIEVVDIGPFISLGIKAGASIEASGTLLIGAGVEWDNIDIMIDLLDSGNSHANGLVPKFLHRTEASGELSMEARLGLPIKLGIGVSVLGDFWEASAAVVDTPSVVLEGSFEVSAEVTDEGTIEYDINGGCYGIAWNVHFENTLEAEAKIDPFDPWTIELLPPQESDPIFEGCIGYVKTGLHDDNNVMGIGSSTGAVGNGMNSGGNGLSGGRPGKGGG